MHLCACLARINLMNHARLTIGVNGFLRLLDTLIGLNTGNLLEVLDHLRERQRLNLPIVGELEGLIRLRDHLVLIVAPRLNFTFKRDQVRDET